MLRPWRPLRSRRSRGRPLASARRGRLPVGSPPQRSACSSRRPSPAPSRRSYTRSTYLTPTFLPRSTGWDATFRALSIRTIYASLRPAANGVAPTERYLRTMQSRLYDFDGEGLKMSAFSVPPLAHFHLRFRSATAIQRWGKVLPWMKVYEIVD